MIILNPTVGVAPGTTTMQLGEHTLYIPYTNTVRLHGIAGLGTTTQALRWGLVLTTGVVAFSLMLGLRRWRGAR